MPEFHRASKERISTFEVGQQYFFKYYFEESEIFDQLKGYYNNSQYRFEIPREEFDEVSLFLSDHGYALVTVSALAEFAVVVEKYSEHPDNIFQDSVLRLTDAEYNVFLMKDRVAVEQATLNGATRLTETNLEVPF